MSNFNIDNFEKLLKERSDEFKMYPTKRVWYSIYNNIHPGKKWPSIATCITLISILLLIGFLNSNNHTGNFTVEKPSSNYSVSGNSTTSYLSNYNFSKATQSSILANLPFDKTSFPNLLNSIATVNHQNTFDVNNINFNTGVPITTSSLSPSFSNIVIKNVNNTINNIQNNSLSNTTDPSLIKLSFDNTLSEIVVIDNDLPSRLKLNTDGLALQKAEILNDESSSLFQNVSVDNIKLKTVSVTESLKEFSSITDEKSANIIEKQVIKNNVIHTMSDAEKSWVESYALHNRPEPKKWLGKLGWQIYITPSVVYRTLKNILPNEQNINNTIVQKPALGLEIGGGIISNVSKNVKLKTGLQLNFTRYNAEAYENSHPVATSITIRSEMGQTYQESRSTPYSNNGGISPIKLHNETFQVSIPMGMDVALLNIDNLQWSVGATIQPSYIIGGKSYLISTDKRNYIKESSLLNRWNVDAGFETFISYKTNGFTLQFGPQFRKQLFTTNNKNYFIQEHLNNYGFKFGISKLIK